MTAKDIKILGVTVTYNNEDKIPYVMPYYERIGIDKLVVYDNESTDKTVEMLSRYPFVEIRSYHTDKYDEGTILKLKTDIQNEFMGQYDWCISTYFDEVFYSERDFREVLYEKMCEGKTYFLKTGLNIFSRHFPPTNNGKLIHENVGHGSLWTSDDGIIGIYGNKAELFNMKKVFVNYNKSGCHECQINGDAAGFEDDISFFHIKFIDFDFIVKSNELYRQRTEGTDITCYDYFSKHMEEVYQLMERRAISVKEYMNTPMDILMPQQVIFLIKETDNEKQKEYIDAVKNCSDYTAVRQYGLLFYGESGENYDNMWYYAREKDILSYYSMNTNDPTTAAKQYSYEMGTTIKPNPWICEIDSVNILTYEFFDKFDKELNDCNKKHVNSVKIDGNNFTRYFTFISNKKQPTVGCYMIVKNEEETIGKCLESIIDFCDEIAIVDTGCSDKTMEVAKSFGPKIKTYNFTWVDDFSAARNFAMSKIGTDYTFTTDADEVFTKELQKKILEIKNASFYGVDIVDIYLLNYNGTDSPNYYLGGRQIVKNRPENLWKYKVHEKLYLQSGTSASITIDKREGLILHKHNGVATSNYNKYAETYYNEMNSGKALLPDKSVHFFYYMFLTLKDIDMFGAKRYLYNAYDASRIAVPNEDIRLHLVRDGYISFENSMAFELINKEPDTLLLAKLSDVFSEDFSKYIILRYVYEHGYKWNLTATQYITLAYDSYKYGLVNDFIEITRKSAEMFRHESIIHNLNFIDAYITPTKNNTTLLIDARNGGNCVPSLINLFSEMFDDIAIIGDVRPSICLDGVRTISNESEIEGKYYIVDGNMQIGRNKALSEFECVMYAKPTEILKQKNGG